MTRKLLPYEYQLVEALGISEEEYIDFVAAQPIYQDAKEGTLLDARAEVATIALVLTIVGTLFQVASVLLAPKPKAPEQQQGIAPSRDERVMPRFGFNGVQDLAAYGSPVPLIYTNIDDNSRGGVRVNTSLVWSLIASIGGNQLMRLLLVLGAGKIQQIDFKRIAIGQLSLSSYTQSNIWVYWNNNGYPQFGQLLNTDNIATDPSRDVPDYYATANVTPFRTTDAHGFSQAIAPTTSSTCSITGVIPVNIAFDYITDTGSKEIAYSQTELERFSSWNGLGSVAKGQTLRLRILNNTNTNPDAKQKAVEQIRYAEASVAFLGGRFKLGSAIFRVTKISGTSLDFEDIYIDFICEEAGRFPTIPYSSAVLRDLRPQSSAPLWGIVYISIPKGEQITSGQTYNVVSLTTSQGSGAVVRANASLGENHQGTTIPFFVVNGGNGYRPGDTLYIATGGSEEVKRIAFNFNSGYATDTRPLYGTFTAGSNNVLLDSNDRRLQRSMFYTKCLASIEEAYYSTSTKCQAVEIALKLTAYRRLSGRSSVYGSEQKNYGYKESDNGGVMRTSMFRLYWRFADSSQKTFEWNQVPYIFAFRASNEQSIFTYLKFIGTKNGFAEPRSPEYWQFKLVPVTDPVAETNFQGYCYLLANGRQQNLTGQPYDVLIRFTGSIYNYVQIPPLNRTPSDLNEWDLWNYDSASQSQFSFEQGPELVITAVNEQLLEPWTNYGKLFDNMATIGFHALATTTTQDLRSISAWVEKGKMLRTLSVDKNDYKTTEQINALVASDPTQSSSYASDIFLDTVLDDLNGIGKYASIHSVDVAQLAESKRFCKRNRLFMDGVIADQRSWREFWVQTAPFSLLELARIGGRDTLIPSIPYNPDNGIILSNKPLQVSALFTAGNILEDSYKEEFVDYGTAIQDTIVTVVYRDSERDGVFSRNATVELRLKDINADDAAVETIDASSFVTRRDQAILIGKLLCLSKRYFRRVIEFKTFPTDSPIAPGSYIYVEIGLNKWNSIYSGRIESDGELNAPLPQQVPNGTYTVFVYTAGQSTRQLQNVNVTNGKAAELAKFDGSLFVLGTSVKNKRVFRVTEVAIDEEGETTVKGIEHPTDANGISVIAQKLVQSGNFFIDGQLK